MNPILVEALGSILRWLLTFGAGYLVSRGVWTSEKAEVYVSALAIGILTLGWSLWQHSRMRLKLLTALGLAGVSEQTVQNIVKNPTIPNPSLAHPKDEAPDPPATSPLSHSEEGDAKLPPSGE